MVDISDLREADFLGSLPRRAGSQSAGGAARRGVARGHISSAPGRGGGRRACAACNVVGARGGAGSWAGRYACAALRRGRGRGAGRGGGRGQGERLRCRRPAVSAGRGRKAARTKEPRGIAVRPAAGVWHQVKAAGSCPGSRTGWGPGAVSSPSRLRRAGGHGGRLGVGGMGGARRGGARRAGPSRARGERERGPSPAGCSRRVPGLASSSGYPGRAASLEPPCSDWKR
ncbi:PREDICTED: spidroin-1-like [Chinchilla lanigera]|uniref:spidroin-1-like n=1 Tax=Chinchilla lanigera TaxID=34839 RepID=UPI0006978178|nr:PREDICTED: spidroin-1-like [Chinchilla lanigera]